MLIYGVLEELRKTRIEKVLNMDCRALDRRILAEFKEYTGKVNEQNLKGQQGRRKTEKNSERNVGKWKNLYGLFSQVVIFYSVEYFTLFWSVLDFQTFIIGWAGENG